MLLNNYRWWSYNAFIYSEDSRKVPNNSINVYEFIKRVLADLNCCAITADNCDLTCYDLEFHVSPTKFISKGYDLMSNQANFDWFSAVAHVLQCECSSVVGEPAITWTCPIGGKSLLTYYWIPRGHDTTPSYNRVGFKKANRRAFNENTIYLKELIKEIADRYETCNAIDECDECNNK